MKKMLSLLLAFVLVLSNVPVPAHAQQSQEAQFQEEQESAAVSVDFLEYLDECVPVLFQNTNTIDMQNYLRMAYGLPDELSFTCSPAAVEYMEYGDGEYFSITLTAGDGYTGTATIEGEVRYLIPYDTYYANYYNVTARIVEWEDKSKVIGTHTVPAIDTPGEAVSNYTTTGKGTIKGLKAGTWYDLELSCNSSMNYEFEFRDHSGSPGLTYRGNDGFVKADNYGAYVASFGFFAKPERGGADNVGARPFELTLIFEGKASSEGNRSVNVKSGNQTFTAPVKDDPSRYTYSWKKQGSSTDLGKAQTLTVNAQINETYICTISRKNTKDIDGCLGSDSSWTYTVNVVPTVEYSVQGLTLPYTGQPQELASATCTGGTVKYLYNNGDRENPVTKKLDDRVLMFIQDIHYLEAVPTATEPGTYYIYYRVYPNEGYLGGLGTHTWNYIKTTIQKPKATVTEVPTANTLTYSAGAQQLVTAGKASTTMLYAVTGDSVTTAPNSGWSQTIPSKTAAGTYKVWYKAKAEGNYSESNAASVLVTISRREVTVSGITANSKTYDGNTDVVLNFSNAVIANKAGSDDLKVSATGKFVSKNVGAAQTVNISNLTLTGGSAGNYVLKSSGNQTTTTAAIKAKPVTATVTAKDKTYDGNTDAEVTATANTGVSGETLQFNTITGHFATADIGTGIAVSYEADLFVVTAQGNGTTVSNYAVTYTENVEAAIQNAPLTTVSVKQDGTLTYNGEAQTAAVVTTAESINNQPVTFNYSVAKNGTYSNAVPAFTAADTYTVYYKASAPNHETNEGSFTITVQKQAVATPSAVLEKTYTGSNLTADVPESSLYTIENQGGTEAGNYPVVLTLTDAANYRWENTEATELSLTFTITAADNAWLEEPAINGWTYGESPAVPDLGEARFGNAAVRYTGKTNGGADYDSETAPTQAGEYRAVFTVAATGSYGQLTKEIPFLVVRAALPTDSGFRFVDPNLTYTGTEQSVTVTTNLEGVAAEDITLNYSATPKNAGEYTFTISVGQSDNYEASVKPLTNESWKFAIAKAQPVITWDITEFTYNTRKQGEAAVTLVNNEAYQGTIHYTHKLGEAQAVEGLPTDAGIYTVTASIAEQDNYQAAETAKTVVIKPKEVAPAVVLTPDTYTYDGQAKQPAVKVMDDANEIAAAEYTVSYDNNIVVGVANVRVSDSAGGNYVIAGNTKSVFLILPDVSALEGITAENVTSAHQAAIDAIQAAMAGKVITEASEQAQKQWNDLLSRCDALEKAIADAAAKCEQIVAGTNGLPEQIKTSDLDTIQKLLDEYQDIEDNLTEDEKEALADEIQKLEDLEKAILDTNADLKEITDGTEDLKKRDLEFADKATIADLQDKIADLEENPYLIDEQKQTLEDAKEQLEALKAAFAEAEKVEEQLKALPKSAKPDNKTAVEAYEAAKKAYEDLGEDQSKVDPAAVKKLENLKQKLTDYRIIKGNGAKWVKGSSDGLTMIANGYFGKFTGVMVDGRLLRENQYMVRSGSTIVILHPNYLKHLREGKHSISICYGDGDFSGEAEGRFEVVTDNGNPFTGDTCNVYLWSGMAMTSLLSLAMMAFILVRKKEKMSSVK